MKVILASASPRRKEILVQLRIPFEVQVAKVSEILEGGIQESYPCRLAERKALAVSEMFLDTPVLGFDTLVFANGEVLGKPKNEADALWMLEKLNGKSHYVISGVALAYQGEIFCSASERTEVFFRQSSKKELENYVASKEPLDKAGAYGIQGLGARLVKSISGCYYNVVGLPVAKTLDMLEAFEEHYG